MSKDAKIRDKKNQALFACITVLTLAALVALCMTLVFFVQSCRDDTPASEWRLEQVVPLDVAATVAGIACAALAACASFRLAHGCRSSPDGRHASLLFYLNLILILCIILFFVLMLSYLAGRA